MSTPNNPVINIKELEQSGFIVPNVDKAVRELWATFGIGPWNIITLPAEVNNGATYYGKPAKYSFKAAFADVGSMQIELIEPLDGNSIYNDFLKETGGGFHHLGWYKPESLDAFHEAIKKLEEAGFPCIMSGYPPDAAFAYFDTTKVLGTLLEAVWFKDPSAGPSGGTIYPE